jgi:hypothetical protein
MSTEANLSPLLPKLASPLIQATPEHWTEATLRVEVKTYPDGRIGLAHDIKSEQYPQDVVSANDEIFALTREIQLLCDQAGHPWSVFTYRVEQVGNNWKFSSNFEYA